MEEATQVASTHIYKAWILNIQFRIVPGIGGKEMRPVLLAMVNLVLFQEANYLVMAKDLEVEQSLVDLEAHLKSEVIPLSQGTTVSSALVWIHMA